LLPLCDTAAGGLRSRFFWGPTEANASEAECWEFHDRKRSYRPRRKSKETLAAVQSEPPSPQCSISVSIYAKIPTARDAPSAIVISEMSAWSIISSLARAVKGKVSDGENAVALVNAKKR